MSGGYGEHSPERVRELARRAREGTAGLAPSDAPPEPAEVDDIETDGQDSEDFDVIAYAEQVRDRARRTHRVGGDIPSSSLVGQVLMGGALEQAALDAMATKYARAWRLAGAPIGRRWADPR